MKRIAITGPESTGKSWLCENLAAYFDVYWVMEYARQYLEEIQWPYVYNDLKEIAKGQLKSENSTATKAGKQKHQLLFCDTDFLVLYIWSIKKYGKCDPYITKKLKEHKYDLYLLCNIDLPWEYDPLRENPDDREILFNMYESALKEFKLPYRIISGKGEERLMNAVKFIENC